MNVDPARVEKLAPLHEQMVKAIRDLDAPTISRVLADPAIERYEFVIGRRYRLKAFGAPPVEIPREVPKFTDAPRTMLSKIAGVDHAETAAVATLVDLSGVYRGRLPTVGFPHAFRDRRGRAIVLADLDIVGWEEL